MLTSLQLQMKQFELKMAKPTANFSRMAVIIKTATLTLMVIIKTMTLTRMVIRFNPSL
jgi:hypothetical protein